MSARGLMVYGCLFLALALLSREAGAESAPSAGPVRVGAILSLTGPAEKWGTHVRKAMELGVQDINAAGGISGRPLEVLYEDSRTDAAGSVTAYKKLVELNHVRVVIGDVWSFVTLPLLPLSAHDKVLLISPTLVPDSVEKPTPYFFTLGQGAQNARGAVDRFLALQPLAKRASVLCWDDPWGDAYLRMWREAFRDSGVRVLEERCSRDFAYDYRTDIAKIATQKPAILAFAYQGERILKVAAEQNFHPLWLSTSNIVEVLWNGSLPQELLDGVYYTDWRPNPEFLKRFREAYGTEPFIESHNGYEAVRAAAKALEKNAAEPAAALRTIAYEGIAGPVDFTKGHGANFSQAKLMKIENGSAVQVWP